MNLLPLAFIVGILPAFTVSSMKICEDDNTRWCTDEYCSRYPLSDYIWKNCKKTCGVCKPDGSCGLGYYGEDCSPCKDRCKKWVCDKVSHSECPQNCPVGKRGIHCTEDCASGCQDSCDRWNKVCHQCKQGKRGFFCSKSCPRICRQCNQTNTECTVCNEKKTFGARCRDKCEHCDDAECDILGYCMEGCMDGWTGDKCDIQESSCFTCLNENCNKSKVCVDGCKDGYWGNKCEYDCRAACKESKCEQSTGHCTAGCVDSYYGQDCSLKCSNHCKRNKTTRLRECNESSGDCLLKCVKGWYLNNCSAECSQNCINNTCFSKDGRCKRGCTPGWFGGHCNIACGNCTNNKCDRKSGKCTCNPGWYGVKCFDVCSDNCKHLNCTQDTGACSDGCNLGFYGLNCSKNCPYNCNGDICNYDSGACVQGCKHGYYGETCTDRCSKNCRNMTCNFTTGVCVNGCNGPFYGIQCNNSCSQNCKTCNETQCFECEDGYYGKTCEHNCSSNCEQTCNKDGSCSSCKVGFYGLNCDMSCSSGCNKSDGLNMFCNKSTGRCIFGCRVGFYGERCDRRCSSSCKDNSCKPLSGHCGGCKSGFYGDFCHLNCSANCKMEICLQENGTCPHGCNVGYFGNNCSQSCSDHCKNSNCSFVTGMCSEGCESGWYGNHCDQSCSTCKDFLCHQYNGTCSTGCQPGSYGGKCHINCSENCKPKDTKTFYVYCEQNSGKCIDGCVLNKYGDRCSESCSAHCVGDTCNQTSGDCDNGCDAGRYGLNCTKLCSRECGSSRNSDIQCNQTTGHCLNGCQVGRFGPKCTSQCDSRCLDKVCERTSGTCERGCITGWEGEFCNAECPHGYYGYNCNMTCGHCVEDSKCDRFSGDCPNSLCEEGFSGSLCKQIMADPAPSTGEVTVIAVTGVLAVVIVVLVAVIICVVYRRKKTSASHLKHQDGYCMVSPKHGPHLASNNGYELKPRGKNKAIKRKVKELNGFSGLDTVAENKLIEGDEYQNLLPSTEDTVIKLPDLWDHVQHMKSEGLFIKQFENLPSGLVNSFDIAMKPQNRMKNRYKNICAYDCSRVVLNIEGDDPNSDYINACYIDGFSTPKQYIASQGPVDVNLNDFWRMIWQQNTCKIVMLTNLVEEGRIKCITYWPELDQQSVQFGNIDVKCILVEVLAHFTVRTFKIHCITEDLPPRVIKHFHYTSWPDRGVPTDIASLVEFYIKVDKTPTQRESHYVVHCSAGIGRTGTFLALAYLVEASKHQDFVDIYGCVSHMRYQRVNMVQTEEQYEFLHDALVEAILAGYTTVSSIDFLPTLEKLQTVNPETGVIRLKEQFELLNKVSPKDTMEEYTAAKLPENTSKNRFNDILASNYYRPYLSTPVADGSDYINAVVLPAYKDKRMFLLTQMPLNSTIVDFWRMIYENNSHSIVMLNGITQHPQNVGIYWPTSVSVYKFGPFEVENLQHESLDYYNIITLSLRKFDGDERNKKKQIKLFQCVFWPSGQIVPRSAVPFFTLMENVQMLHQEGPVTVHCIDGVERSGLYCVLTAIMDRLKIEQDVSIVQTINQMRACRKQLIRSYTQFEFCYKAVHEYFEGYSLYSNFA